MHYFVNVDLRLVQSGEKHVLGEHSYVRINWNDGVVFNLVIECSPFHEIKFECFIGAPSDFRRRIADHVDFGHTGALQI